MEKNNKENIADWVPHPNHYQRGGIECFDVIKEFFGESVITNCEKRLEQCSSVNTTIS